MKLTGKSAKLNAANFLHKKIVTLICGEKIAFYSTSRKSSAITLREILTNFQ